MAACILTGASGDDPGATSSSHYAYSENDGLTCDEAARIGSLLWSFCEDTRDLSDDISCASFLSLSQAVAARLSRTREMDDNIPWDPKHPYKNGLVDETELSDGAEREISGQITRTPDRLAWLTVEEGKQYQNANGEPRKESTWYGSGPAARDLYELLKILPHENRAERTAELLSEVEECYHERGAKTTVTQRLYEQELLTSEAADQWSEAQNLGSENNGSEVQGRTVEGAGEKGAAEQTQGPESRDDDESHKRGVGIGYEKRADGGEEKSGSAPTDTDSEGSESMWKSHDSGSLREKVPVPKPVSDVLESVLDWLDLGEYRPVLRWHLAHVYYCQTRMPNRYSDGVPVAFQLLKQACRDLDVKAATRTKKIWEAAEAAGILHVSDYIYRDGDTGRSREYRISENLLRRFDEALADSYEYKTRYNLVTGERLYSAYTTYLTHDGEHSWEERSTFIHRVLKRLEGSRDLVNRGAVEDHLDWLEGERDAAQRRHDEALAEVEQVEDEVLEEGKELSERERERLESAREKAHEIGRELGRVSARLRQDRRIWSDINSQGLKDAEDQPEGIFEYETAWEVQEGSGRLTCLCGLQNASEEMKAAASKGIPEYKNYDISSSQTEALIMELEMAVRMGADLDVSILKEYAENDGKDGLAAEYGIHRDRWKRPEHSIKFGAGFNHDTFAEARAAAEGRVLKRIEDENDEPDFSKLHHFEHESGESAWERAVYNELPTMAAVARDWADDEDIQYHDAETVYSILRGAYEEMAEELDAWRDWLVDEYWTEAGQNGSRFGYFVSNPCSIPFSIYDARHADSGDEPDRWNQKTAFATSRLQGREAAYIHALTLIQDDFSFDVLRNEHDGLVVVGSISNEAREMARRISGFHRAELETKPFDKAEDQKCDTKTSKRPSGQSPQEKPLKSRTSQSEEVSGSGSAGGTAAPDGAKTDRTPSGYPRRRPGPSGTTSGTTSRASEVSGWSTGKPPTSGSRTSSDGTTGSTSHEWPKTGNWGATLDLSSIGVQDRPARPPAGPPERVVEDRPARPDLAPGADRKGPGRIPSPRAK
jgi:hypothetical protein